MGNRQGQYNPPQVDPLIRTEKSIFLYHNSPPLFAMTQNPLTITIFDAFPIDFCSRQYGPNSYSQPVTLPVGDTKMNEAEYQQEKVLSIPPNHSLGTVALYDYRNVKYFGGFDVKSAVKGMAVIVMVKTKAAVVMASEKTNAAAANAAAKTNAFAVKAANSQAVVKTRAAAAQAAVKTKAVASKAVDKTKAVAVSAAVKTKAVAAVAVEKSRAVAAIAVVKSKAVAARTRSAKHVTISEVEDIPAYESPMQTAYV